ncbi:hypothetical protein J3R30DRAFT_3479717 [Lentinula aciculospora]|uniref:CipC protein n=1 Tax=Lentinula aciculospora TaxID=153920 RepID=A0A9W9ABH4_9AGAR|nr:hypothetical protein J3R30DRAFT_3479717 [Lentinula aciculospora]
MAFSDDSDQAQAWEQVNSAPHQAKISHELLGAAASYEAIKAYEKHREENGEPDSHATRNEIIATLAGGFIDRMVETKGLDFIDKEKAKYHAKQQYESQF